MNFFYSASTMNYGNGYKWHSKYQFPKLPIVTRTLTIKKKIGIPFAILKYKDSVWNKVGLHNIGLMSWINNYYPSIIKDQNIILSIAGTDYQIEVMISIIEYFKLKIKGIELNLSCPNIKDFNNKKILDTKYDLYLKLNHKHDPYDFNLDRIKGIRLNSIPTLFGGVSGEGAKEKNWGWIKKYIKEGINIAGCSFSTINDVHELEQIGCKEIGIGSVILTNPSLVEKLS